MVTPILPSQQPALPAVSDAPAAEVPAAKNAKESKTTKAGKSDEVVPNPSSTITANVVPSISSVVAAAVDQCRMDVAELVREFQSATNKDSTEDPAAALSSRGSKKAETKVEKAKVPTKDNKKKGSTITDPSTIIIPVAIEAHIQSEVSKVNIRRLELIESFKSQIEQIEIKIFIPLINNIFKSHLFRTNLQENNVIKDIKKMYKNEYNLSQSLYLKNLNQLKPILSKQSLIIIENLKQSELLRLQNEKLLCKNYKNNIINKKLVYHQDFIQRITHSLNFLQQNISKFYFNNGYYYN